MRHYFNKISYLFENGWRYAAMKIFARIPIVKLLHTKLIRPKIKYFPCGNLQSQHFEFDNSVDVIVSEVEKFGFSNKLKCKIDTISQIELLAQRLPLYAYHNKENRFFLNEKTEMEKKLKRDILIAQYANLKELKLFKELEKDPVLLQVAEGYLGKNAKCIASQMWWTFPANVSEEEKSKAAHLYHRDLDAFQFMKFFIYATDVEPNDGGHFFVQGSHKPSMSAAVRERFRISRINDQQINKWYHEEAIIEMIGPKGSVIVEDTFGFHKGRSPSRNPRLLVCLVFANQDYGVQRFNA